MILIRYNFKAVYINIALSIVFTDVLNVSSPTSCQAGTVLVNNICLFCTDGCLSCLSSLLCVLSTTTIISLHPAARYVVIAKVLHLLVTMVKIIMETDVHQIGRYNQVLLAMEDLQIVLISAHNTCRLY